MKSLLALAVSFSFLLSAVQAQHGSYVVITELVFLPPQSLLTNGSFETGALSPWTGTGTVSATVPAGFNCTIPTAGSISQTVSTVPGRNYYLAVDSSIYMGSTAIVTMSAVPSVGGTPDGTITLPSTIGIGPNRTKLNFTASTSSTTISISVSGAPIIPVTVDNVVLYSLTPSQHKGAYTGMANVSLKTTNPVLENKSTRRIIARIDAENRITILDGTDKIYSGLLLNDGTFDLAIGSSTTLAMGIPGMPPMPGSSVANRITGTATIKQTPQGKRIVISFTAPPLPALDELSTPVANSVKTTLVLTRTGP
jgi:opacity protein-like surface antigen